MRRRRAIPSTTLAVLALFAPPALAQDLSVYLNGGLSVPSDPPEFEQLWETGYSFGGGVGVRVSEYWELGGAFHVERFPIDELAQVKDLILVGFGRASEVSSIDGRDATTLTLLAEARFHVPTESERWLPFLAFGWGYFEMSTSDAVVTPTASDIGPVNVPGDTDGALGVTFGGGLQVPVSPGTRIVFDTIYTIGFTERVSTQYLPVRIGFGFRI